MWNGELETLILGLAKSNVFVSTARHGICTPQARRLGNETRSLHASARCSKHHKGLIF